MRIEVRNISFSYSPGQPDEANILDGVSFVVEEGSFTGIIGHTGSGKTTLVQQLNGLLKPSSGTILAGEADITSGKVPMADIRRKIGLVFQYPEYQLFEETVAEDIAFGPRNTGMPEEEIEARTKEAMKLVGLEYEQFAGRSPFELSGGQKRRAAIAGVLAMEPEVLIMDEPAAGLDPGAHTAILEMIENIRKETGCSIILVSHNMDDIGRYCDQVLVLDHGRLVLSGTPDEVFGRAEELASYGLGLPSGRALVRNMQALGAGIPEEGILTEEQAADAIEAWWKGKR